MTKKYKGRIPVRQATLARYKNGIHTIKIQFPYSPDDVAIVRTIPGRKYNPTHKIWTCPPTTRALLTLEEAKFLIDPKLRKYIHGRGNGDQKFINIPGLKKQLFRYQNKGVSFLQENNGRALIGDEMGLGKTIQAIGYLQKNPKKRPVLIICPASVKLNWEKEIREWMGFGENQVEILNGRNPHILSGDILIGNYDILDSWFSTFIQYKPKVLIIDECQYIKSNKAKRTKSMKKLAKHIPHIIALSGTPIVNRPVEFYNIIQILNRELFPNWLHYTNRYCNRRHNGFGWDVSGASNIDELHEILTESLMIRRSKAEVLEDLPDKIYSFFPLEMDPKMEAEYDQAEHNFLEWMETRRGKAAANRAANAEALAEIEVLKQVAVSAKMPHAIEWIQDFLDTGQKLVVFATHKFVIQELMEEFGKIAVKLDGSVTGTERQQVVEKFQNEPEIRLFVGNIKAAGVGITLTAASNVAFLELPWTPGELSQATDRLHRIGQKDSVNVYYLLAEQTVEERIARLLDQKREVLNSVLDGTGPDEKSLLVELIENY